SSRHTFLDVVFRYVWRRWRQRRRRLGRRGGVRGGGGGWGVRGGHVWAGVDSAAGEGLADSAAAVLVAAEPAAVGSQRGHKWFPRKRLMTLSAVCDQRREKT